MGGTQALRRPGLPAVSTRDDEPGYLLSKDPAPQAPPPSKTGIMPISYRIDVARDLILTTGSGTLSDADIVGLKEQLAQDRDFKPGMRELSDLRSIDRLDATAAGVRNMVQLDARESGKVRSHRLALVVSQEVAYGMARMYQALSEPHIGGVAVFRDIDEARAWLDIA